MCLIIDLRRAAANSNSAEVKDLLAKLEPVAVDMDKEVFPSLAAQPPRISNDPLVDVRVKNQVSVMAENFTRIRGMFAGRMAFDNNQLRQWKQTHKQMIADLSAALKLEFPAGMMIAFDDHEQSQSTILTVGPQSSFGMYGSRLGPRFGQGSPGIPRMPGGMARPPGIGPRRGIR